MRPTAPTLDSFESPSMRETPGEHYVFGDWFTAPAKAASVPVAHRPPAAEKGELSLFARLLMCSAAGLATGIVIMLIAHVATGR